MPTPAAQSFALAMGLLAALAAPAHADEEALNNYAKVALASVHPATASGDLNGPPGTTPPGIKSDAGPTTALGLIYGRRLGPDWSLELAAGLPPTVKVYGAGAAAGLGEVGRARVYYPAVVLAYALAGPKAAIRPYVGAGVNYTWFRDARISDAYNAAVHASATSGKLSSGAGMVVKIGAEIALDAHWFADVVVQRYGIRTSATLTSDTPGFGPITRTQDLRINPNLFALAIARRF